MSLRSAATRVVAAALAVVLAAAVLAACPRTVRAADPPAGLLAAADRGLAPLGGPGFVRLTACTVTATLQSDGEHQTLAVEQVYALHNRDRIESADLQVGLALPNGEVASTAQVTRDAGELTSADAPEGYAGAWQLTLAPDESCVLRVTSRYEADDVTWVRWQWQMPDLAAWDTVEGLRIELRLPAAVGDDAFEGVSPGYATFDGSTMAWEYEGSVSPNALDVTFLSPGIYVALQQAAETGDHAGLAQRYASIQAAAEAAGIDTVDYDAQILGEWQAAATAAEAAGDATAVREARTALTTFYEALAAQHPLQRLNYTLLAIREAEWVAEQDPGDLAVRETLGRLYDSAAQAANEGGDPEGALVYLHKARDLRGDADATTADETTSLRWALELARRGRVSQALVALDDALSPGIRDALLRYAPPLASARTVVTQSAAGRTAHYELSLYAPSAAATTERVQAMVARLQELPGCTALLAAGDDADSLVLDITMSGYRAANDDLAIQAALGVSLAGDADTLTALLAVPWSSTGEYEAAVGSWHDRYYFVEQVPLEGLRQAWDTQSQYVSWRLVELQTATAEDERAEWEQALARIALAEQRQVWASIPAGTYWVYQVDNGPGVAGPTWTLAWDAVGQLDSEVSATHWPPSWQAWFAAWRARLRGSR